jgi:hypothetical protein
MALPIPGELDWGTQLNSEITADETTIAANGASLSNHESNIPADPHGDRAFATNLVTPITTGTNEPNGYVVLNAQGKLPLALVPVGAGLTNFVDAIPDLQLNTDGSDVSVNLNTGIADLSTAGGGIMWVGSGTFGLASPILMQPNVWLWCSPGAVFNRITITTPPTCMITNFNSLTPPSSGNMWVTGGTWDVATVSRTGCIMLFAGASFLNFRDMQVTGYPDGQSPIGRFYGCTDINFDNIVIDAEAPANSGRGNQVAPVFEIEELNITNIPGVPTGSYTGAECSNIHLTGCNLTAGTLSDSYGEYCAWSSFCGTTGTITGSACHSNIKVDNCVCPALAAAGIEVFNWINVVCVSNFFSYPFAPYSATWQEIEAQVASFIFDINSPPCYTALVTGNVQNTSAETTVAQFLIPANDWNPGTTSYRHHFSGLLWGNGSATLTVKLYIGPNGNNTDALVDQFTVTPSNVSGVPFSIQNLGVDAAINPSGPTYQWFSSGSLFISSGLSSSPVASVWTSTPTAVQGEAVYVTWTGKWSAASNSNIFRAYFGVHERISL